MPFPTSAKGGADWEPVPAGTHIARCVTVVDLGLQDTGWGPKQKVYIGFEVPSQRVEWEKEGTKHEGPAIIGSTYTNSISDKAILGQHLTSWRGKPFTDTEREMFDLFNIVDIPCMISVTHKKTDTKTYANITGIMGLPAGTTAPDRETPICKYHPLDPETAGNLAGLPEWMQKKIASAVNEEQTENPAPANPVDESKPPADYFDDDIPF